MANPGPKSLVNCSRLLWSGRLRDPLWQDSHGLELRNLSASTPFSRSIPEDSTEAPSEPSTPDTVSCPRPSNCQSRQAVKPRFVPPDGSVSGSSMAIEEPRQLLLLLSSHLVAPEGERAASFPAFASLKDHVRSTRGECFEVGSGPSVSCHVLPEQGNATSSSAAGAGAAEPAQGLKGPGRSAQPSGPSPSPSPDSSAQLGSWAEALPMEAAPRLGTAARGAWNTRYQCRVHPRYVGLAPNIRLDSDDNLKSIQATCGCQALLFCRRSPGASSWNASSRPCSRALD